MFASRRSAAVRRRDRRRPPSGVPATGVRKGKVSVMAQKSLSSPRSFTEAGAGFSARGPCDRIQRFTISLLSPCCRAAPATGAATMMSQSPLNVPSLLSAGTRVAGLCQTPRPRRGFGRYGIVDVGVLRHFRDGGRTGRIVLRVVVARAGKPAVVVISRLRLLGVDGPEHDPVVVGPPDRFCRLRPVRCGSAPRSESRSSGPILSKLRWQPAAGFRVCCGSLGA